MSGVRVPVRALAAGTRVLSGEASSYLCRVRRLGSGDAFVAFDPDAGTEADATIDDASPDAARVTIRELRAAAVTAALPIALVYALAKGDKVDAVVRDATELGATRIVVAATTRSVVKIDDARRAAKTERWRRVAEQAARQSGRSDPPEIVLAATWTGALAVAAQVSEARFVLDPRAAEPLGPSLTVALRRRAALAFAIGPEGGLTNEEIDEARAAGFAPITLGPFVLRTETVAAAVLGAARVLTEP